MNERDPLGALVWTAAVAVCIAVWALAAYGVDQLVTR